MPARVAGLVLLSLVVIAGGASAAAHSFAQRPCTSQRVGVCESFLRLRGGGSFVFYRNFSLEQAQPAVERAIIVVHGNSRDVRGYFKALVTSAALAGHSTDTLVVAPYFQDPRTAPAGQLAWDDNWKEGGLSVDQGRGVHRRYAFELIDEFLVLLSNRSSFPNLREVIVTGHSAGGQFTQRYAALNAIEPRLADAGVRVRYVVANPSSYMYLNPLRFINGRFRTIGSRAESCPNWNTYRYGLHSLSHRLRRARLAHQHRSADGPATSGRRRRRP
jgi:pimeloyl-ACP methyl ester carboxylesterase